MGEHQVEPARYKHRATGLPVIAWRVSLQSLQDVARFCNGQTWAASVIVPVALPGGQLGEAPAQVGDWVVRETSGYRVMSDDDFRAAHHPAGVGL